MDPINHPQEVAASVLAVHPVKQTVRSALKRQMEMGNHLRASLHHSEQFGCQIARFEAAEPKAAEAGDLSAQRFDKIPQRQRSARLAATDCCRLAVCA